MRATGDVPFHDAMLHESGSIASRNDSAAMTVDGGRTGDGRATAADGCGDDGGDDDMRARRGGRRVPCGAALSTISPRLGIAMTVDGTGDGTGDGRATDGRTAWWCGSAGAAWGGGSGLRALTVGTTGLRCGRCTKIFLRR